MAKLFIVVKEDTVIQMREYLVRADTAQQAQKCIDNGFFICETEAETMDLVSTRTTACEEIAMEYSDDHPGSSPKIGSSKNRKIDQ